MRVILGIVTLVVAILLFKGCAPSRIALPLNISTISIPDSLKEEPLLALSDSTQWKFRIAGKKHVLERHQVTWVQVNHRYPNLYENIEFYDNDLFSDPTQIEITAYYPNGDCVRINGDALKKTKLQANGLQIDLNGYLRTASIPRYCEGLKIRINTVEQIFHPEFYSLETVRGDQPTLTRFISMEVPRGCDYRVGITNGEKLAVQVDSSETDTTRIWKIDAKNLPKILPNHSPLYSEDWYAALHFSIPSVGIKSLTWAQLGDFYLEMIQSSLNKGPETGKISQALKTNNSDSLLLQVFSLVKNKVRYLADSKGMNAWVPRSPESVWKNGYGDCKEMSNLMRSLLTDRGIEVGIALVRAGPGPQLSEDYPALNQFNHAIFYSVSKKGLIQYLDPTLPAETGYSSYLPVLGQKTFLISKWKSRIDTVRAQGEYVNKIISHSSLSKNANGDWELIGKIEMKGKRAMDLWLDLTFQNIEVEEAKTKIKRVLLDQFGVDALDCSWKMINAETVEIKFVADGENIINALNNRAVKIDFPLPYHVSLPLEQEGLPQLEPFEQTDSWVLPDGYSKLKNSPLNESWAIGTWSLSGQTLRRDVSVKLKSQGEPIHEKQYSQYFENLNRFSIATVWR